MGTNILSLPQFSSATFALVNNAAWLDSIYFAAPGFPGPAQISGCATIQGSSVVTVPAVVGTAGISVGMQISGTPNFPNASYVGTILSATTFTMADINGNQINATTNNAEIQITFNPPPLDLTGIGFVACLRQFPSSPRVFLAAQTGDGTLINGGKLGTLSFNVPRSIMQGVPAGTYFMDILAADATSIVQLFPQQPATVTLNVGIADLTLLTGTAHP